MGLNDHWFKHSFPSWWTGKLSDFMGMFYFPLQLAAFVILLKNSGTWLYQRAVKKTTSMAQEAPLRKWVLSRPLLLGCIFIAALCLASVKLSQYANQWITEFFHSYLFSIRMVMDPTDLWALSMLPLAYFYGVLFIPPQ